ncbi:hypothetical protein HX99_00015 [Peptococcaceae bacterium SCADC1_2_3]|jgi:hypothetical protein|nr:hypothetical protein DK28_0212200 [Peptococcaceae bacterium SCADC1_2_3]KFI34854.1 hypothetical protein HY00_09070 [Peptococcaceae bacterium SCADC1_2_3]KFI37110.1 hypothetical protein HX99_00015 [Peptococcaceae bacterium SCADC1_2_3]
MPSGTGTDSPGKRFSVPVFSSSIFHLEIPVYGGFFPLVGKPDAFRPGAGADHKVGFESFRPGLEEQVNPRPDIFVSDLVEEGDAGAPPGRVTAKEVIQPARQLLFPLNDRVGVRVNKV